MTIQIPAQNSHLTRARASQNGKDCMALYHEWAATYNDDLADASQDYVAPVLTAQAALQWTKNVRGAILDAGCGTGLVGEALAQGGAVTIDGVDLSPAMLKVAEQTGVYRNLDLVDLTKPINKPDDTYDIVTCAGTFTQGHVGPDPALREFVRLTKPNGLIVATILHEIWKPGGYKAEVEKLEAEGLIKVLSIDLRDYRRGPGDKATLIVLEKTESA
ncbi:S-adenosyl-L-methionine-dependent methyltransferase [Talaromyces proteolyticus]|uniref:S-adenosyl-L-methionine-dependent methyltransferase n=1 Tax=Talaromyces proteolyticus TaxID=1131652 RepID=A0AAD4L0Z9_9EURO|nr:S-adenosyl-L-methionine-dependent methyltransferase [Talaromyces proteolyticus]KAH8705104.1 S-adenosyl-L-methionine-dependent methyltransferase [Talaromyces proteolyticus]